MELLHDIDLSTMNSLALPSRARYFVRATCEEHIDEAVAYARDAGLRVVVLGGGTNLVLPARIDALVLQVGIRGIRLAHDDGRRVVIGAGAGEIWHGLVAECLACAWHGLENLALIPGTVGAAPVQNIGAYGVEVDRFVYSVRVLDLQAREWVDLSASECDFAYRDSVFRRDSAQRYVISEILLQLDRGAPVQADYAALRAELDRRGVVEPAPRDVFEAVTHIRRGKLPDPGVQPNAGSFFKNPVVSQAHFESLLREYPKLVAYPQPGAGVKLAAAWLIEQAGFRGHRYGDVGMHQGQSLVLVNYGGAEAVDVLAYAEMVSEAVQERFGVDLQREPLRVCSDGRFAASGES